ncbi:MAG: trigger factor [Planctomycetota bacterium]|nr:trigger factor [Planctomycetota bacterium]
MQVQVAETGPCTRKLTIQVPEQQIREHMDSMYASANQQVRLKGFRQGKVPRKVLEKHLGNQILVEAKQQLVNRFLSEACQSEEIRPIGNIVVDNFEELEVAPDSSLEFTVQVNVRPNFELGETKGLEAAAYETEVTDTDLNNALQEIANQKRSIGKVDEPSEKGDFVKVDLEFQDEEGNKVHERSGVQLNTTIPLAGTEQAAFEEALTGTEAGKSIELALTFPDNFEKDEHQGKPGKAVLQVLEVMRVTAPPIDDELAKGLDFENLDALKKDLGTRIGNEKERVGKQTQEEECLRQLLDQHAFEVPQTLIEEQQQASLKAYGERMKQSGVADAEIETHVEKARDEALEDATRRVRMFFLIDEIAQAEKLFVTEGDVESEIKKIAQANEATPAQVYEHLQKNNQLGELRLAIVERKVRDFLRENAKIVDRKDS